MQQLFSRYAILCLMLFTMEAQAQLKGNAVADSLRQVIRTSKPDSSRVKLYLQLAKYYRSMPGALKADMDSTFAYATKAANLSRTLAFAQGYEGSQTLFAQMFFESKKMRALQVLLEKMKSNKSKADILLTIGQYYLYKPYELPVDLDSAIYYTQATLTLQMQLRDTAGQARSLMLLAEIYKERGDLPMVKKYQEKVIPVIEKVQDLAVQSELWTLLGDSYTRSEESMQDKIKNYGKALALYRQLGNKEREAHTLKIIADMHQHQGDYDQSLRELLEVLRIQKSIGLRGLHYTYDLLGHVYARMGNFELALPYALDAIRNARATADTITLVLFYHRVGGIYQRLNQHTQAIEIFRVILNKLSRESGNTYFEDGLIYMRHMNRSLMALKRSPEGLTLIQNFLENGSSATFGPILARLCLGEAFIGLKDYRRAEKHLAEGLARVSSARVSEGSSNFIDWDSYIIAFNSNLIELYLITGRLQRASLHLKDNFSILNKQPEIQKLSNLHLQAFKLDSLRGDLSSAIAHYQQYKALQDSIFNERKSNQLIAYQVQYETEKKEQDLKIKEQNIKTLTKEKQLQQQKIEKERLIRNGIIGGAVLLLLLLAVIYNRYLFKQQSNKLLQDQQSKLQTQHEELQTQQDTLQDQQKQIHQKNQALEQLLIEKERLLKEIHHRVKNNLQIVMSLLNSQVASMQDKTALSAIQDSQNRIQAMALIHQKLYQAEGVARIPMKSYVEEVVAHLRDSYALSRQVSFKLHIESIELDVSLAVPVGLIINEAITNAFKHAFPGERSGVVKVNFVQKNDTNFALSLEDDGVGLPTGFDPSLSRSLGMTLIHGFSAQLGGELFIESNDGIKISIVFPDGKSESILEDAAN